MRSTISSSTTSTFGVRGEFVGMSSRFFPERVDSGQPEIVCPGSLLRLSRTNSELNRTGVRVVALGAGLAADIIDQNRYPASVELSSPSLASNDLMALIKRRVLKAEGNLQVMANLHYFKESLEKDRVIFR
jgi:hypothetical protein